MRQTNSMEIQKQPIRVLHYLADLNVASGVINILMNFYRHIDREKFQFDFLYFDESPNSYKPVIEQMGGRCYRIPKPGPRTMGEIRAFFRAHEGEYVVLHCHPVYAAVLFAPVVRKFGVKCVIQHSHSTKFGNTSFSAVRNYCLTRFNGFFATGFLACSQGATRLLGPRFVWKNRVLVLENTIDCERFSFNETSRLEVREHCGIPADAVVIGHSGRLSPEKNQAMALRVFAAFHAQNANSYMLFVGDGDDRAALEKLAADLKIADSVIFAGRQREPEKYLSAMDVFLFPSLFEGLSLALLEAQCSGLPCVVSDTVDLQSRVTEHYTAFSLKTSPEEVAELLRPLPDRQERTKAHIAFRKAGLDIQDQARRLEEYYVELMNR